MNGRTAKLLNRMASAEVDSSGPSGFQRVKDGRGARRQRDIFRHIAERARTTAQALVDWLRSVASHQYRNPLRAARKARKRQWLRANAKERGQIRLTLLRRERQRRARG